MQHIYRKERDNQDPEIAVQWREFAIRNVFIFFFTDNRLNTLQTTDYNRQQWAKQSFASFFQRQATQKQGISILVAEDKNNRKAEKTRILSLAILHIYISQICQLGSLNWMHFAHMPWCTVQILQSSKPKVVFYSNKKKIFEPIGFKQNLPDFCFFISIFLRNRSLRNAIYLGKAIWNLWKANCDVWYLITMMRVTRVYKDFQIWT